jgi:hypothetical protein
MTDPPPGRLFRRSLTARLTSLAALLLFGGAAAARLLDGDLGAGFAAVAALALLGAVGAAAAWGDRVRLDARAVTIENRLWQALGRPPRRLAWEEVAALSDQSRASALGGERLAAVFVIPRRGRPLPLDALDDLETARALAQAHLDAARRDAAIGASGGDPPA